MFLLCFCGDRLKEQVVERWNLRLLKLYLLRPIQAALALNPVRLHWWQRPQPTMVSSRVSPHHEEKRVTTVRKWYNAWRTSWGSMNAVLNMLSHRAKHWTSHRYSALNAVLQAEAKHCAKHLLLSYVAVLKKHQPRRASVKHSATYLLLSATHLLNQSCFVEAA